MLYLTEANAALLLLLLALIARLIAGSWLAPGALFAGLWVVAFVPAVIWASVQVDFATVAVVAGFVIMVTVGSHFAKIAWHGQRRRFSVELLVGDTMQSTTRSAIDWDMSRLKWIVGAFGMAGLYAGYMYVAGAGYSLFELGNLDSWMALAVHYSVERYHGGYVEPIALRVLLATNYTGAALSGFLFGPRRNVTDLAVSLLPVLAAALITLLTSAKAPLLISTSLIILGSVVARMLVQRRTKQSRDSFELTIIVVLMMVVAAVAVASLVFRVSYSDSEPVWDTVTGQTEAYLFGHVAALNAWVNTSGWLLAAPTWGAYTLAGPFEMAGISVRIPGLYEISAVDGLAAESNVFTVFRSLISDFTLFGAFFVTLLFGMSAGYAYEKLRLGRGGAISASVLVFAYASVIWSPIASLFSYNVIVLAAFATAVSLAHCWRGGKAVSMKGGGPSSRVVS